MIPGIVFGMFPLLLLFSEQTSVQGGGCSALSRCVCVCVCVCVCAPSSKKAISWDLSVTKYITRWKSVGTSEAQSTLGNLMWQQPPPPPTPPHSTQTQAHLAELDLFPPPLVFIPSVCVCAAALRVSQHHLPGLNTRGMKSIRGGDACTVCTLCKPLSGRADCLW